MPIAQPDSVKFLALRLANHQESVAMTVFRDVRV